MTRLRKKVSFVALLISSMVIVAHALVPHHHHGEGCGGHHSSLIAHCAPADHHCAADSCRYTSSCGNGECNGLLPFVTRLGGELSSVDHLPLICLAELWHPDIDTSQIQSQTVVNRPLAPCLVEAEVVGSISHRGPPVC